MHQSTEHLATAARTQLDAQLQLAASIAGSLIDGMEKFAGLNLQATKASIDASINSAQSLLAASDAQQFLGLASQQAQPQADIALTYGRHLSSIASDTHRSLSNAAEAQINASSRQLVSLLDDATRLTPGGSPALVSMVKSAIDNISSGYVQLNKSAKVAMDAIESNMQAASTRIAATRN